MHLFPFRRRMTRFGCGGAIAPIAAGLICISAAIVSPAHAHDGHEHAGPPPVASPREMYEPSLLPDRIVLTWSGDPSRSMNVTWRTSAEVAHAFAEIAVAEAGPGFVDNARRVDAETQRFQSNLSVCHIHSVAFENLEPNTIYAYRVGDGAHFSEWFQFTTADDSPAPFSFVYFGDAQNDVKSMWSRVIRQAHASAPDAAFMLHAGDLIDYAPLDEQWAEWFSAGGWLNAMIPVVPTPGNHEYYKVEQPDGSKRRVLAPHWHRQFALPENGPAGLAETAYYIDYQDVRIISLNSNENQEEQVPWLVDVLENNPNTWTIITFHHPIFSPAKDRDNPELRELWKPVFDRYAVDLVLNGHDHTYARSGVVGTENVPTGSATRSSESGTVYVVSVSGPKMYHLNAERPPFIDRAAETTQLYQIISIDGDTLTYEARTALGDRYDGFTLRKRTGQPNELINEIPDTPERRWPTKEDNQE